MRVCMFVYMHVCLYERVCVCVCMRLYVKWLITGWRGEDAVLRWEGA